MNVLLSFALVTASWAPQHHPFLHAPSVDTYATHNPSGVTILPEGRLLKPVGVATPVGEAPHGLAIDPGGTVAFVASDGMGQFVNGWRSGSPTVEPFRLDPDNPGKKYSNAGGACFSPDGSKLYWSSGETGAVYVYDRHKPGIVATISLNAQLGDRKFEDSYAMDLKLSSDGKYVYCADVTNFRVAVVDCQKQALVGSVTVGRYPYALAVDGDHVFVANIGAYEYSPIPAPSDPKFDKRGLTFPPFGVPSKEAREGVDAEGRHVPGLGDPNDPAAFSVFDVDASDPTSPSIRHRIKTGIAVGGASDQGAAVGGSGPCFLVADRGRVYVSNYNNDTVQAIDEKSGKIVMTTRIIPSPLIANLRGVGPAGLAVSPDGSRLYVAETGMNAIGVIDTKVGRSIGHIPTAWFPYRVAVAADGKTLCCICFKGFGNGPNAGKNVPTDAFRGLRGSFHSIPVPSDAELSGMTRDVLAYNGLVDASVDRDKMTSPVLPEEPGLTSPQIKYVVFITKENHTYDTIFDHVPGANDDPSLLRWGYHQKIANAGQPTLDDVPVMINHNALAKQFTVSDNFYMEPEASGVGHRWLIGVEPNNWCQLTYTLGWNFKANSTAPGRRASFGSNGSIAPEDYPEAGSMWEHLARHGKTFRNYGESFEFAGVGEDENEEKSGAMEVINMPMSKVVYDNTCRDFPIFNMNIPDQMRAQWFGEDFTKNFLDGKHGMPNFVNIAICNDHGTDPNPKKGYPYRASWMADNDMALGKIVDFLSHTPYWKNMLILVTQDDAGGEPDHVDAQRSVLLAISPWIKHKYVSHRHTTILSMHRTLYEIFGLPPLNFYDAVANDFSDCFTTTPDYTPYKFAQVDSRIFDWPASRDKNDPNYAKARKMAGPKQDDPAEMAKQGARGG